jgi:hypothetical protein
MAKIMAPHQKSLEKTLRSVHPNIATRQRLAAHNPQP